METKKRKSDGKEENVQVFLAYSQVPSLDMEDEVPEGFGIPDKKTEFDDYEQIGVFKTRNKALEAIKKYIKEYPIEARVIKIEQTYLDCYMVNNHGTVNFEIYIQSQKVLKYGDWKEVLDVIHCKENQSDEDDAIESSGSGEDNDVIPDDKIF
jgi:hypothetical protein